MNQRRPGFTLVELLVVITIIGILMGLLIPAVNAAREAARRNQCSTQIKNLALGAIQRENSKGELPGYIEKYGVFGTPTSASGATTYGTATDPSDPADGAVPPHVKLGTWAVALLPYLDGQATYERWTEDRYPIVGVDGGEYDNTSDEAGIGYHELAAPNLAIMQCPSNPVSIAENGKNSYIANTGFPHKRNTGSEASPAFAATVTFAASQSRDNGAFNCKYYASAGGSGGAVARVPTQEGPAVRLDDFKDGQGNTMLFSENVQALPWHRAGLIDPLTGASAGALYSTTGEVAFTVSAGTAAPNAGESARYVNGMVWHYADPDQTNTSFTWNLSGTAPTEVLTFYMVNGGGTTVSDDIFTKTIENATDAFHLARPSSAHVEGVNAGMADGGTRFITNSIDYRVYQALLTPRGKSSDVPWPEYILDPEAI
ncbi:MAG: DUF1559 domain-containing protein [Planctomycetota bacterium]